MDYSHKSVADTLKGHWAERYLPNFLLPYARLMRLERPIGWWLLLLPCWWSVALVAIASEKLLPNFWHLFLFFLGAVVMRGTGCVYNDLLDRDIDAKVERTRARPLPSGQVSVFAAFFFALLLALCGLIVLLQFNRFTVILGFASLAVVAIYPLMKRFTYWPQVVLGLAFSWGALMGWAATQAGLSAAPFCLYIGAVCWTIAYDTIYAHQDKEDDVLAGVKSTALLFQEKTKGWLFLFFMSALLSFALALFFADSGPAAFIGLAGMGFHFFWQIVTLDIDDDDSCLIRFRSNRDAGLIFFAGLVTDSLIANLL